MALPLFPSEISLSQIRDEFGQKPGASIVSLSDYYAGGGLVRSGTLGYPNNTPTPIPSSGAIALSNFFGAKKTAVVEDFVQYHATISSNVTVYSRCDTGTMFITTAAQQYPFRSGQNYGEDGVSPPMYGSTAASRTIGWRTGDFTQADYNALNLMVGDPAGGRGWSGAMPPKQNIKTLFRYTDLIPLNEGDLLYYHYGVKSDDYGYIGFKIYDFVTKQWSYSSIIGGDMNSADGGDTKCWLYSGAGIQNIGGLMNTKMFSGKKLILPYWRVVQVGSRSKYFSQEFSFAHARNIFGGADVNGKPALPDRGATFQQLLIPNITGKVSPYPEVFEINGTTMTLKADIAVTTHVTASSNNSYGFAPEKNRAAFVFPTNLAIFKTSNTERWSEYINYVFKAGVYQLNSSVIPMYNPTIYVL